jgi:hypothetical protein
MEQYIDKTAVVAEINRVLNSYDPNEITSGRYALVSLRNFLDTLEVKEVGEQSNDLEEEIDKELHENWYGEYINLDIFRESAKHFFELGLKAQKQ